MSIQDGGTPQASSQAVRQVKTAVLHQPVLLVSLGLAFLNFGLPIYAKALGASALEIGGLFSVFTLSLALLRPLAGWALDRLGRKAFLVAGLGCYAASLALFALAASLPGFYLARLVQGLASSITWISISTIVADLAGEGDRAREMGAILEYEARGELVGAIIGFALLNVFAEEIGWTIAFLAYTLMAAVASGLAWKRVPETRPALPEATEEDPKKGVPKAFLWLLGIVFTTLLAQSLLGPIYLVFLQDKFTTDYGVLALAFIPSGVVFSLLPARMGSLSDRIGRAPFMALGLFGSGVLNLLLPSLPGLTWLVALYTLASVGWTMAQPAESALVADLIGSSQRGRAYGWYQFASSLGATFGPLIGGWVYDNLGRAYPFYLAGVVCLLSAGWVMLTLKGVSE